MSWCVGTWWLTASCLLSEERPSGGGCSSPQLRRTTEGGVGVACLSVSTTIDVSPAAVCAKAFSFDRSIKSVLSYENVTETELVAN